MRSPRALIPALTLGLAMGLALLNPAVAQAKDPGSSPSARAALAAARNAFGPRSAHQRDATLALRDLWRQRDHLRGNDRLAADRMLARPTDAGGDNLGIALFAMPANSPFSCSPHFCVHYMTYGSVLYPDSAPSTSSQVQQTLAALEHVWSVEVDQMGYHAPLSDDATSSPGNESNPDGRLDVYLGDLGRDGIYGYCAPDGAGTRVPAYCALDNDFDPHQFGGARPGNSLAVTAAHEFFHAVQFGYNVDEASWFMEGSAVWMEDRVYDSINDYYQYIPHSPIAVPSRPVDDSGRTDYLDPYGAFTIFRYSSDRLGADIVRSMWERAVTTGNAWSALTGAVAATGQNVRAFLRRFGFWNTLLPGTYAERSSYGAATYRVRATLSSAHRGMSLSTSLARTASAPIRLAPGTGLTSGTRLRLNLHLPYVVNGGSATLQVMRTDGSHFTIAVPLNAAGDGYYIVRAFRATSTRYVAIVLTNTRTSGGSGMFTIAARAS